MPKNTIYKNYDAWAIVLLMVATISCGTKKQLQKKTIEIEENPKLIFLNYTVSKKENGEKNIVLINKIAADGRLKKDNKNYLNNGVIGDLTCTQLDKNYNTIQTILIENPLSKVIEFVNDSLIFEKRIVDLDNIELALKLQLDDRTKSIIISEIIDSLQTSKTLIKTVLE